ncbi:MAG: PH domain-containing protein [Anaerolineae bacterium]|nr:PH domain-containing protein [Anaerolineae bacterium]
MTQGPEKVIGEWHESKANIQFWLKTILTLSLWYWLFFRHNQIRLTTRRVIQQRGSFITTNDTSTSIENITNVDVNISLLGRIFNYGDINIQTAGSSAAEIAAKRLQNPDRLRDAIFDLRDGRLDETTL